MNSKDASERLGISLATLNRRVASGELKPVNQKTPGQKRVPAYLFLRTDVERLAQGAL